MWSNITNVEQSRLWVGEQRCYYMTGAFLVMVNTNVTLMCRHMREARSVSAHPTLPTLPWQPDMFPMKRNGSSRQKWHHTAQMVQKGGGKQLSKQKYCTEFEFLRNILMSEAATHHSDNTSAQWGPVRRWGQGDARDEICPCVSVSLSACCQ